MLLKVSLQHLSVLLGCLTIESSDKRILDPHRSQLVCLSLTGLQEGYCRDRAPHTVEPGWQKSIEVRQAKGQHPPVPGETPFSKFSKESFRPERLSTTCDLTLGD